MENDVARYFSSSSETRNLSVVKITYREVARPYTELRKFIANQ